MENSIIYYGPYINTLNYQTLIQNVKIVNNTFQTGGYIINCQANDNYPIMILSTQFISNFQG